MAATNPLSAALSGGSSINGGDAGPATSGGSGDTGNLGLSIGDYYGGGARVRQASSGLGWQEMAAIGVAAVVVMMVWSKVNKK